MESKSVNVRMENITKAFGNNVANKNVNLEIYDGEILSLLGENGSGKTTLMNMLAGIYFPDAGDIYVKGEKVVIRSPKDAYSHGIGMIHQHFKLVDVFTSMENIVSGIKPTISRREKILNRFHHTKKLDKSSIKDGRSMVIDICNKYGFKLDLDKKVYDMSVSEKQTLEIIKAVYRGADLLILDEPTAVLTPLETEHLFDVLRNMKNDGKSIIIITHKLNEVMEISDRVAVLRKGECIGSVLTKDTNENQLTEMMVGKKVELNIRRDDPVDPKDRLIVENLNCKNEEGRQVLKNISFTARSGEILGIAGISGSGQKEILESIAGLVKDQEGTIVYINPEDEKINLRDKTPGQIRDLGVRLSFVPEDRLGMGLVGSMDLIDNMMLRSYQRGKTQTLDRKHPRQLANDIVEELDVKTPSVTTPVRTLSGGNVQKVLVGREIALAPKVLMVAYPVRGLDINSSYLIYNLLNEQKTKGVAVIYVGEDLDVLIALSDRIVVLGDGEVRGILDARKTDKMEVGRLMTKETSTEAK
jgi:general nucleoside transport system ATP-binding protein